MTSDEKENTQPHEHSSTATEILQNKSQKTNEEEFITPADFRPTLKGQPGKNSRKNRKKGRNLIATDMPEKEENARENEAKRRRLEIRCS